MTLPTTTAFVATFDRIGRKHDVPPLNVAGDAEAIAEQVYRYARPRLASRDVEVLIDLDELTGTIFCGMQIGGHVTLSEAS